MKIHYYGKLDSMESCYTFQTFNVEGLKIYIQNSPRFGYEPATLTIKDPAMFIERNGEYYRFVIEDFKVDVADGIIQISELIVGQLMREAIKTINL